MKGKNSVEGYITFVEESVKNYNNQAINALEKLGEEIGELAEPYVPEDTGRTLDSYYAKIIEDNGRLRLDYGYDLSLTSPADYGQTSSLNYLPLIYAGFGDNSYTFRKPTARPYWLKYVIESFRKQLAGNYKNIIRKGVKK